MKVLGWILNSVTLVKCVGQITKIDFAQTVDFLDPILTSDGRPYGPHRFKEIAKERYLISRHCHTSYKELDNLVNMIKDNIDEGMLFTLKWTFNDITNKKYLLHLDSVKAYNFLVKKA